MNKTERFGGGFNFVNAAASWITRCNARRVIDGPVKNLVALQFGMTPEMVPVRGVNDIFVAQFRIASLEFADHVVRFERAKLLLDVDIGFWLSASRAGTLS